MRIKSDLFRKIIISNAKFYDLILSFYMQNYFTARNWYSIWLVNYRGRVMSMQNNPLLFTIPYRSARRKKKGNCDQV